MDFIGNAIREVVRRFGLETVKYVMPLGGRDYSGVAQAARTDGDRLAMHFAPQYGATKYVIAGGAASVSQALTPGVTFIKIQCPTQPLFFTVTDAAVPAVATDHYLAQGEILFMRIDPSLAAPNINVIIPGGAADVYVSEVE